MNHKAKTMPESRRLLALLLLLTLGLLLPGCDTTVLDSGSGFGSVVLRTQESSSWTAYRVYGYGPSGQVEQWEFENPTSDLLIPGLAIGRWQFIVDALNSQGVPVISGSQNVHISADKTATATVTLGPIEGHGQLAVEFRWPSGLLQNPVFEADLSFHDGGDFVPEVRIPDDDFELDDSGDFFSYRYQGTHEAGYYELFTSISDDSGHPDQHTVFAVRVFTDLLTTVVVDLETGDGSVEFVIIEDPQDPLTVLLNVDGDSFIAPHEQITIVADVSGGSGNYQYRWYLNRERLQDELSATITLGPGLEPGRHRVSLVASDGIVLGSDWIGFDVAMDAP